MTVMNRSATADALGIAKTTLDEWVQDGAPVINKPGRKGIESQYDTAAIIRWWIDRERAKAEARTGSDDLDALRARKIEVETEMKQLQLAREAGQVVPLHDFEHAMAITLASIRGVMLALPQRAALRLAGETDTARITQVLKAEVMEALNAGVTAYTQAVEGEYPEGVTDEA